MIDSYTNYEWFLKQDFSRYSGKWLAILDKKLVATNDNVDKLLQEVKQQYPSRRPLITKVRAHLSIL